eukprot:PhM_4_TR5310/c0_g1_i1/m.81911
MEKILEPIAAVADNVITALLTDAETNVKHGDLKAATEMWTRAMHIVQGVYGPHDKRVCGVGLAVLHHTQSHPDVAILFVPQTIEAMEALGGHDDAVRQLKLVRASCHNDVARQCADLEDVIAAAPSSKKEGHHHEEEVDSVSIAARLKYAEVLKQSGRSLEAVDIIAPIADDVRLGMEVRQDALLAKAGALLDSNKPDEAIAAFSEAATLGRMCLPDPKRALMHANWALAVLCSHTVYDKTEALEHLDTAITAAKECDGLEAFLASMEEERVKARRFIEHDYKVARDASHKKEWAAVHAAAAVVAPYELRYFASPEELPSDVYRWVLCLCASHALDLAEDCSLGHPQWTEEDKDAELRHPLNRFLVILDKDAPVAVCVMRFSSEYGAKLGGTAPHVYVWDLHVDPQHRGQGMGSALLRLVEAMASEASVPEVRLQFFYRSGNNSFYKKRHGYSVHPDFAERHNEFKKDRVLSFEVVRKMVSPKT